jgi:type IV pilus assembly protein PilA
MRRNSAFTLVEMMIVVAIIALLAAIAVPAFMRARQRAQNAKFINALRIASSAIEQYAAEHQSYPPDANRGVVPPGFEGYLGQTFDWTGRTPIGGNWDWDFNIFGVKAAVSVVAPTADGAQLLEIDSKFDDGDLSSGRFQALQPDRYSDIVER